MDAVIIKGTLLLLNRIYDSIGFNRIQDETLRHLVIARVTLPGSKLATVSYLKSYYDEDVELNLMVGNAIAQSAQPILNYNFGMNLSRRVSLAERVALRTALTCGITRASKG